MATYMLQIIDDENDILAVDISTNDIEDIKTAIHGFEWKGEEDE